MSYSSRTGSPQRSRRTRPATLFRRCSRIIGKGSMILGFSHVLRKHRVIRRQQGRARFVADAEIAPKQARRPGNLGNPAADPSPQRASVTTPGLSSGSRAGGCAAGRSANQRSSSLVTKYTGNRRLAGVHLVATRIVRRRCSEFLGGERRAWAQQRASK